MSVRRAQLAWLPRAPYPERRSMVRRRDPQTQGVVEDAGLVWSVVESVPIHEDSKPTLATMSSGSLTISRLCAPGAVRHSHRVLQLHAGARLARTDLEYVLPDGSKALRFDQSNSLHSKCISWNVQARKRITRRRNCSGCCSLRHYERRRQTRLTRNIIAGLPGAEEGYTLTSSVSTWSCTKISIKRSCAKLCRLPESDYSSCWRSWRAYAVHPDDPPRPILGLPRIVSTLKICSGWLIP